MLNPTTMNTKHLIYTAPFVFMMACNATYNKNIIDNNIDKIEVLEGFSGEQIQMEDGFEQEFLQDLNQSINREPTKFAKSHRILIYHSDGSIDSILTNGRIHQFNGWWESDENLLEKYRD